MEDTQKIVDIQRFETENQRQELHFYMSNINVKREGFWFSEREPQYLMPIPNVLTEQEAFDIYTLIKIIEDKCEQDVGCYRVTTYRGSTVSRITGQRLGATEYVTSSFIFPGDFGRHYVLEHKVKPSDDFLEYIGYLKNKNKEK